MIDVKNRNRWNNLPSVFKRTLTFQCIEGQLVGRMLHLFTFDLRQQQLPVLAIVHLALISWLFQVVILEDDWRQQVDSVRKALLTLIGAPGLQNNIWAQLCAPGDDATSPDCGGATGPLSHSYMLRYLRRVALRRLKTQHEICNPLK